MSEDIFIESRAIITVVVYVSFLLDNILMVCVVPILPDYLSSRSVLLPEDILQKNFTLHFISSVLIEKEVKVPVTRTESFTNRYVGDESFSIGFLLAAKAVVQIITNPIVGVLTAKFGYRNPLIFGTGNILLATLMFAFGESYLSLLLARAIQGIGSAFLGVCGMSMIAYLYPEEAKRSKIMGVVLGSIAMGVLFGYPFGGILYGFINKSAPFFVIATFLLVDLALQICLAKLNHQATESGIGGESCSWYPLLSDSLVVLGACAIWISTSAMAILEPCLPLWLIENFHPQKWQLGTVFIPDSLGYFLGTNFLASYAYRVGQIRVAVVSLVIVGVSCFFITATGSISGLMVPQFFLGFGIGALDAALVPLLASTVDRKMSSGADDVSNTSNSISHYGAVYAIQQMAVSLAYSIAPIVGGELAEIIGFPWIMRLVGFTCVIYAPLFLYKTIKDPIARKHQHILLKKSTSDDSVESYKRFYDTSLN